VSLEWKERMLEPEIPPPPPAFDLAKWKQKDYSAGEAWERERAYRQYHQRERATSGQPSLGESPWWQRPLLWLRDGLTYLVLDPPPLFSISYGERAPGSALQSFGLDEWVTYQPRAGGFWDEIWIQSVSVRGDITYKVTSNPSGLIDINLANGRITFSTPRREGGSRSAWYIQPGSLGFGVISTTPIEGVSDLPVEGAWDSGEFVSVTAIDLDIVGRNWASFKVSHGEGTTFAANHEFDDGEIRRSRANLALVEMTVHRWPRVVVAVGMLAAAILGGWEAVAALTPAIPALQPLRSAFGF